MNRLQQTFAAFLLVVLITPIRAQENDSKEDEAKTQASQASTQSQTLFEDYLNLKGVLKEKTGLGFTLKYSGMHMQRAGTSLSENNYNLTGQFDVILGWDVFSGAGTFNFYYMHLHQLGGLTTTDFGNRNGIITPINDSDPNALLRQLFYQHRFLDERLAIGGGKVESVLLFTANRYVADDRFDFQALPLSNAAVKDRTFSSPGFFAIGRPADWLSIGASVNSLNFSTGIPKNFFDFSDIYSFLNITLEPSVRDLGKGFYRVNFVVTDNKEKSPLSNGLILSFDQDLGDRWAAFFRWDGTDIQTLSTPLVTSVAGGTVYRGPFGRTRDHFGIGLFRTRTEQGEPASEVGMELFYRLGMTEFFNVSFALQAFNPARADKSFINLGVRFHLSL